MRLHGLAMNTEMLMEMILFPFSLRENTARAGLLQ
jgi:hypothetical protein